MNTCLHGIIWLSDLGFANCVRCQEDLGQISRLVLEEVREDLPQYIDLHQWMKLRWGHCDGRCIEELTLF